MDAPAATDRMSRQQRRMPISHGPVAMDERAATQDPGQIATQDAMDATAAMGEPLATQDPDDAERLERMAIALLEVLQFKVRLGLRRLDRIREEDQGFLEDGVSGRHPAAGRGGPRQEKPT